MRSDRAATIRAMTAADFAAQKDELVKELASLRGVEPGWCHEEAGIIRTTDGSICEVSRTADSKRRAVAWTFVVGVINAVGNVVICLLCFKQVFPFISYFVYRRNVHSV